jgi:LEA14-like dessication related protein
VESDAAAGTDLTPHIGPHGVMVGVFGIMLQLFVRWLATTAILILLAACGSRLIRQPLVTLESVALAGLGLRGGTLMVNVQIENPNPFPLTANQVRYQLAIADVASVEDTTWTNLAVGSHEERLSVGAGQVETVQVPVEFTYSGLGNAASSLLRAGTFAYRPTGAVNVSTPLGDYEVPFQRGGVVALIGAQ